MKTTITDDPSSLPPSCMMVAFRSTLLFVGDNGRNVMEGSLSPDRQDVILLDGSMSSILNFTSWEPLATVNHHEEPRPTVLEVLMVAEATIQRLASTPARLNSVGGTLSILRVAIKRLEGK